MCAKRNLDDCLPFFFWKKILRSYDTKGACNNWQAGGQNLSIADLVSQPAIIWVKNLIGEIKRTENLCNRKLFAEVS